LDEFARFIAPFSKKFPRAQACGRDVEQVDFSQALIRPTDRPTEREERSLPKKRK
jgi:hypothetical protein